MDNCMDNRPKSNSQFADTNININFELDCELNSLGWVLENTEAWSFDLSQPSESVIDQEFDLSQSSDLSIFENSSPGLSIRLSVIN